MTFMYSLRQAIKAWCNRCL